MKAYPTPKLTMARWWLKTSSPNDTKGIFQPAAYIISQLPELNDLGVQGYFYIYPTSIAAMFLTTTNREAGIGRAKQQWEPILSAAEKYPGVSKAIYQYANFDNFKQWFDYRFQPIAPKGARSPAQLEGAKPRGIALMDSRLLAPQHLKSSQLASALQLAMPQGKNGMLRGHLVAGGKVTTKDPFRSSSVSPAWRNASVHIIATGLGDLSVESLRRLAPDTGCYSNEVSIASVQKSYPCLTDLTYSAHTMKRTSKMLCGGKIMNHFIAQNNATTRWACSGSVPVLDRKTGR